MEVEYELFDHTADVGVRVRAKSLPDLLRVAGDGLYAVIGELTAHGEPRRERFECAGPDLAVLLRDYLAELLLIFERDLRMVTTAEVEVFEPGRLIATGESRAIDRAASDLQREVKAITYHGLELRPVEGGYEAIYIVDI